MKPDKPVPEKQNPGDPKFDSWRGDYRESCTPFIFNISKKKRSMKKNRLSSYRILLEIIILILFINPMFKINLFTGIFYLIAIGIAFWKKLIFKKKNISWMIILGTLLAYLAGLLIPIILGNYFAGDIISAVMIAILALFIWNKSRKLKKGKK